MKTLADLTTPAAVPERRMLEKDVQKQCVDWARARGYWARKFSSQSQRSVPDYLFARRGRPPFACEFKAPGKRETEAQYEEGCAMRSAGWVVFYADNFSTFQRTVLDIENGEIA